MKVIVFFAVLIGLTAAQLPTNCTAPNAWEARMVQVQPSRRFERRAKITYDATNERIRIIDEDIMQNSTEYFDDLLLYKEQIGYRVNLKTKECDKFTLMETFRPFAVPPGARAVGEVYIGTSAVGGGGVLVDIFTSETERGRYSGGFTAVDCIPVFDYLVSVNSGFETFSINFYDVILGIPDPNVFIPPQQCQ